MKERIALLRQMFRPMRAAGWSKVRIGRNCDGGYVMLDDFQGIEGAISCGVGDDASWEGEMALKGISVDMYDGTIRWAPIGHPAVNWFRYNIGPHLGMKTLADALNLMGHEEDLILKMDIEGGEWDALIPTQALKRFRQIVIELHDLFVVDEMKLYAFAKAMANHQLVHVHGNNFGKCATDSLGDVPDVLETTWVRRDNKTFIEETDLFPIKGLDHPNCALQNDFQLRWAI